MEWVEEEHLFSAIFIACLLVLAVFWLAKRGGFFHLPAKLSTYPVSILHTVGAFVTYLVLGIFLIRFFALFIDLKEMSTDLRGWIHFASLCVLFLCLVSYCKLIDRRVSRYIFWGEGEAAWKRFFKTFSMGILTCFISYPFVLLIQLVVSLLSLFLWGGNQVEQVAVEHLKNTLDNSVLFPFMIFAIVVLVPFMEELLFRGFLQSLLKRYLRRGWAIVITAFVFALVHFADSQGMGNVQLILSLFVLSCFIGFIYEREQTLWAPVALHMTFNGISVLFITLFEN